MTEKEKWIMYNKKMQVKFAEKLEEIVRKI